MVINYSSNATSANDLVEQIGSDRAFAVQADVSKVSDIECFVEAAVSKFSRIDVVIPNAGLLLMKDLESTSEEDFAVAPGPTATDLFVEGRSQQSVKALAGANPFNRLGEPEDIARVIAFWCGDASRWVPGQIMRVNGATS